MCSCDRQIDRDTYVGLTLLRCIIRVSGDRTSMREDGPPLAQKTMEHARASDAGSSRGCLVRALMNAWLPLSSPIEWIIWAVRGQG
jgi:hypothetical protein